MLLLSPGGGIGRHKGLKIPRFNRRAGSIPALGTNKYEASVVNSTGAFYWVEFGF